MKVDPSYIDDFISYFSDILIGKQNLNHEYIDRFLVSKRSDNSHFVCSTLEEAFDKYYWPSEEIGYTANSNELLQYSIKLKNAFDNRSSDDIYDAMKGVLLWGDGGKKGSLYNYNLAWLDKKLADGSSIVSLLISAKNAFKDRRFVDFSGGINIRSNAGFTKIYSLCFDDFCIYDSRVAAALGIIVILYCEKNDLKEIPEELRFYWSGAKGKDRRDPSKGNFKMPALHNNHKNHAKSNALCNRVISLSLEKIRDKIPGWLSSDDKMRRVEAALFMLGKHIPETNHQEFVRGDTQSKSTDDYFHEMVKNTEDNESCTRGKNIRFTWSSDNERVVIVNEKNRVLEYRYEDIYCLIGLLYSKFGYNWFPLGNNVVKVADETEVDGFGTNLYKIVNNTTYAQGSSYLGVVLEELGIFEWNNEKRNIKWKLQCYGSIADLIDKLRCY
jgi:hypothetical protein